MFQGQIVLAQLMDFLPRREFNACVSRYRGDYRARTFSCRDQFLAMAFAQLTFRESLRDIATCLSTLQSKLYHAGFRGRVTRSTLADANERRDWRIYADFAQVLIRRARKLYARESFGVELQHTAYALDSTTIDLCLSLFPWAPFRRHKAAVKLHTLLDLRGNIPCFIRISHGKTHDLTALDHLPLEAGAFHIMDKGYTDFARLHRFHQAGAFFVVRGKRGLDFRRRCRREGHRDSGLKSDQTIVLRGPLTAQRYPDPLRRIAYFDAQNEKRFVFLTNNFTLPALTIARLYKCRWQVELFFKWIKQHLRIKAFYGYSPNAVKTQVWIAVSVYVLVAIVRKELHVERSLGEILQILSLSLFEKTPLNHALSRENVTLPKDPCPNQLPLFDF